MLKLKGLTCRLVALLAVGISALRSLCLCRPTCGLRLLSLRRLRTLAVMKAPALVQSLRLSTGWLQQHPNDYRVHTSGGHVGITGLLLPYPASRWCMD